MYIFFISSSAKNDLINDSLRSSFVSKQTGWRSSVSSRNSQKFIEKKNSRLSGREMKFIGD